jgi:glycosyltransferase involved in cell wall biosynthesis
MDYAPNVDAAAWFVRQIFPSVLRRVPEARLLLVGHDTYHRARPLADGDRIVATGSVADVAPLVAQSTVSVAPIRVGSGTRVKILEALALGVPVVSTTLGAEGLDLMPGREILLADEAERFADQVVRLLTDGVARDALAEAGRAAVESAYSWDAIEQRLADDIRAWLAERR